jgi:hypothetical protein
MDKELYVVSGAFLYQYNKDDSDNENDHRI